MATRATTRSWSAAAITRTIIAPYLARAGLSVLVLERSAHLGGGACSSEGPAPGFVMNHCSHWTRFYGHPAYRDFALHDEGLRYLFPDENEGMIFDDGTSFIGFSASRVVDATHRPPGALARRTSSGRTSRSRGSRSATPRRIWRCSTPTNGTGSRRSGATGSAPRHRGARPIPSRSCSMSPTAGSSPSTSS